MNHVGVLTKIFGVKLMLEGKDVVNLMSVY